MRFRLDITLPELADPQRQEPELEQQLWDALRAGVTRVTDVPFETVFSRLDAPLSLSATPAVTAEDIAYAREHGIDDDLLVVLPLAEEPAGAIVASDPNVNFGRPSFVRGGVPAEEVLGAVQAGDRPARVALEYGVPLRDIFLAMEAAGLALPPAALTQIYSLSDQPLEPQRLHPE